MGVYAIYDVINNHLEVRNEGLTRTLVQLDLLVKEREIVNNLIGRLGITDELRERASNVDINIGVVNRRLPVLTDLLGGRFSCNFRSLYEAIMMGLKNALMILQERKRSEEARKREWLIESIHQMERVFGEQSDQAESARGNLLRFDDVKLKERASRFRDFLDANNERATKAFCRLSKEGGLCDDLTQIKDKDGNNFSNEKDREEHIRGFYETLYKKKMDAILSIEEFLGDEIANTEWVNDRKLNDEERDSLEGPVTLAELKESLDNSNFDSTSGWDGISFKVIRKFWNSLKHLMLFMVNETFENGELMESFKLGVIKIIPKKGNAGKIEDWRPITLLCCGYKIISGIVAMRLEKYLTKIIGRAQKGFMKQKNIHTCAANIITCIAQANANNEGMGVMCVDFKKVFDSVEHEAIKRVMEFFNYGGNMVNMVD
jgi:hypothetical protein